MRHLISIFFQAEITSSTLAQMKHSTVRETYSSRFKKQRKRCNEYDIEYHTERYRVIRAPCAYIKL